MAISNVLSNVMFTNLIILNILYNVIMLKSMFNPLTAGVAYIRVFIFLLARYVPPFKHVKDKM